MVSKNWWKNIDDVQGNGRETAQNDKAIINTIYMKPDFPIIQTLSENCNVNVP